MCGYQYLSPIIHLFHVEIVYEFRHENLLCRSYRHKLLRIKLRVEIIGKFKYELAS